LKFIITGHHFAGIERVGHAEVAFRHRDAGADLKQAFFGGEFEFERGVRQLRRERVFAGGGHRVVFVDIEVERAGFTGGEDKAGDRVEIIFEGLDQLFLFINDDDAEFGTWGVFIEAQLGAAVIDDGNFAGDRLIPEVVFTFGGDAELHLCCEIETEESGKEEEEQSHM
jgi:hypothetical protein